MVFPYLAVNLVICQKARNSDNSNGEVAAICSEGLITSAFLLDERSYRVNAFMGLLVSVFRICVTFGSALMLTDCCFHLSSYVGNLKKKKMEFAKKTIVGQKCEAFKVYLLQKVFILFLISYV